MTFAVLNLGKAADSYIQLYTFHPLTFSVLIHTYCSSTEIYVSVSHIKKHNVTPNFHYQLGNVIYLSATCTKINLPIIGVIYFTCYLSHEYCNYLKYITSTTVYSQY